MKKAIYLLLLLLLPFMVSAKVIEADNNVNIEGTKDSSSFNFGNSINSDADINGIAVFAGNTINSNGKVSYGVYAGNTIIVADEVENDLFAAGNSITITKEAVVPRDAYIAGANVKILTDIGRDLYAGGDVVDIRGITVHGNAIIDAEQILMDKDTIIEGKLTYYENTDVKNLKEAVITEYKEVKRIVIDQTKPTLKNRIKWGAISFLTSYVSLLLLFLIFPKLREAFAKTTDGFKEVALSSLLGLVVLIVVPVLFIIACIPVVTIPISLLMILLYAFSIYFASIISCYLIGKCLYSKLTDKSNWFLELALGIILIKLLRLIPIVGSLVSFICLVYGMGKIYSVFKTKAFKK